MLLRGFDWLRTAITPLVLWEYDPFTGQVYTGTTPLAGQEQRSNCGPGKRLARDPVVMPDGTHHFPCVPIYRDPVRQPPKHVGEPCPPGQHRPDRRGPCVPTPHDPRVSDREVVCRNRGWIWDGEKCVDPARIKTGGALVAANRAAQKSCEDRGGTWTHGGEGKSGSCAEPETVTDPVTDPDPDPDPDPYLPPGVGPPPGGFGGGPVVTDGAVAVPGTAAAAATPAAVERQQAQEFFGDLLPTFGGEEGMPAGAGTAYPLPAPFRPASWGDLMRDPRLLLAQREQDEALRAAGAAAGLQGPALIGALGRGRQDLLGRLAGTVRAEDRDAWGANVERARAGQALEQDLWERAFAPARSALDYGLRARGLESGIGLDERGLGLRAEEQRWRQRYEPWRTLAGFGHARDILGRTQAHEKDIIGGSRLWDLIYGGINQPYIPTSLPW